MITRTLETLIRERTGKGKAIIVFGARQVGKTTLLRQIADSNETLWLNGDEPDVRALFDNASSTRLKAIIGPKQNIVIDEAQRIPNIGISLKLKAESIV